MWENEKYQNPSINDVNFSIALMIDATRLICPGDRFFTQRNNCFWCSINVFKFPLSSRLINIVLYPVGLCCEFYIHMDIIARIWVTLEQLLTSNWRIIRQTTNMKHKILVASISAMMHELKCVVIWYKIGTYGNLFFVSNAFFRVSHERSYYL